MNDARAIRLRPLTTRLLMAMLTALAFVAGQGRVRAQFEVPSLHPPEFFGEDKPVSVAPASRYNRVEGLFLGTQVTFRPTRRIGLSCPVMVGYGFTNKTWRYSIGIHQSFLQAEQLTVGGAYFDETASNDGWRLRWMENSLAALLLKEDFMDYFGRKGWQVFVNERFNGRHTARVVYAAYEYQDMGKVEGLAGALFGGKKQFAPNPPITPGEEQSLKVILELDWRDSPLLPFEGTLVQAIYEKTWQDFSTDGLFVTLMHFRPTFGSQRWVVRAMLGTRAGSLAPQHLMTVGGVGTLRGFRERCQTGQNLLLFNTAYYFGDLLGSILTRRGAGHSQLSLGVFFDAGSAWGREKAKESLFRDLDGYRVLADAGVSLLIADGMARVDFARQVRGGDGSWRTTLRLFSAL
jgi:outer membrane protein assembly factor BamA